MTEPAPGEALQAPLAERMRPRSVEAVVGQDHLLAADKPLGRALRGGRLYSMILWGPPGCGKTTLARLVAGHGGAAFASLSAVLAGVADVRREVAAAEQRRAEGRATVLFIDEIHRFNKAQQDALLPHVESGLLTLVGATTENPSFAVNGALLSRCRVHVLKALGGAAVREALERAMADPQGLGGQSLSLTEAAAEALAEAADGDARRALSLLEAAAELAEASTIDVDVLPALLADRRRRFDKGGDAFYDQISALHKCIRSSNPDAALYWYCRMIDGGCDLEYIARRLLRAASEDIGNADPRALSLTLQAWQCFERLGSPEGELALAQAVLYLAVAAKSNAAYMAYKAASRQVRDGGSEPVPEHLRNAPTKLAKALGHGRDYLYDHDQPDGIAFDQSGFPDEMGERIYYQPVPRGLETKIAERLQWIRQQRQSALAARRTGGR
ncbi:MAG: replication-associated recombination protein A [Xanthomonadales bacterium]|nr:replication-associated recombination protein A [Xanthomonadales bacterium]